MASRDYATMVMADNGTLTDALEIPRGKYLAAIVIPSGWVTADITFDVSVDGTTFYALYDEYDAEVVVQAAASRYISLEPLRFMGLASIKIRSGLVAATVSQTGGPLSLKAVLIS